MTYTIFALDPDNEQLGDALLVARDHLAAAVEALVEYHDRGEGAHCEVHVDSVRDGHDRKPLPWQPGNPVVENA
jgi:hypothetical protein